MTIPADTQAGTEEVDLLAIHGLPLAAEVTSYLNHLAAQYHAKPLMQGIIVHPLNIAEGFARELAALERGFLSPGEKQAAHELADAHHPQETAAARHELADLIAETVRPLADATLAHNLLITIAIGTNLPLPYAINRIAFCLSLDSLHGTMSQRFAPEREKAPPDKTPIPAGMTLVCEPLETGYYRVPDDQRYQNAEGLLLSDPLYRWTMRALFIFDVLRGAYDALPPDQQQMAMQFRREVQGLFRLLALQNPRMSYFGSLGAVSPSVLSSLTAGDPVTPVTASPKSKIIFGRFAHSGGAVQVRNFEHLTAGKILQRDKTKAPHPQQHAHLHGTELIPE